jgi:TPR repeat protein
MNEYGDGVLQDNITAHMWYNIASANGHEKAGEYRAELAGLMTADAIEKATAMARECMNSNYKKCDW